MKRFLEYLFILILALFGADRINFLGLNSNFILTPYLFLSFLFSLVFLIKNFNSKLINTNRKSLFYFLLVLYILAIFFSVFISNDIELSIRRYILLLYTIISSYILYLYTNSTDINCYHLLYRGSVIGIWVNFLFSLLQVVYYSRGLIDSYLLKTIDFNLNAYGGFALRLSGYCLDPNRDGFILSFFLFNLLNFYKNKKKKLFDKFRILSLLVCLLLIFSTISKTGYLTALIVLGYHFFKNISLIRFLKLVVIVFFIFFLLYSIINSINILDIDLGKTFSDRFSSESDSSEVHYELIVKGLSLIFSNFKIFFFGIGYGASYTVLNDVFLSKSANFHSLYLSTFVESGVIAFFAIVALLVYSYINSNKLFQPLAVTLIFFNFFYQLNAEPLFWYLLFFTSLNIKNIWHQSLLMDAS